ncbi:MAG: DUF3179 domain-containing protein [Blastocatellia bacterium]|nr:DUF3179 domain-containing protein [Blastocatellia bacterium]
MWETTVATQPLHFRLAGINNQNFIMQDTETGSWWQQINGAALHGPLAGQTLRPVLADELSFGVWKREAAAGRVLRPDPQLLASGKYASADWETRMRTTSVVTPQVPGDSFAPRMLVVGVQLQGQARAYPMDLLARQKLVLDSLNGKPLLLVTGADSKSVRGFERKVAGQTLEFFVRTDSANLILLDSQTGSEWDFTGKAIRGPLAGNQLTPLPVLKDYWFDWKTYHPETTVFQDGG